jgi:hypothetical protein
MERIFDRKGCHAIAVSRYYPGIPELHILGYGKVTYFVILSEAKNLSFFFFVGENR